VKRRSAVSRIEGTDQLLPEALVEAFRKHALPEGWGPTSYRMGAKRCQACGESIAEHHTAMCAKFLQSRVTYSIHANPDFCIRPERRHASYLTPKGLWVDVDAWTSVLSDFARVSSVDGKWVATWTAAPVAVQVGSLAYLSKKDAQCAAERYAAREIMRLRTLLGRSK